MNRKPDKLAGTNVILLHGSWHGAWCWHKVVPRLEKAGLKVAAPDLPAHGREWRLWRGRITLGDMVRSVTDILDRTEKPATIVAHSRSGIIASMVAERRPAKVRKIVYLAAFMLRDGERAADYFFSDADSLLRGNVAVDRIRLTDMIASRAMRKALYADCAAEDVALARSLLTPEPVLPALTRLKLSAENYGAAARYYIELTQDRAVSLNLQRRMIEQSPVQAVHSIEASHSAYFSRPEELARLIVEIERS